MNNVLMGYDENEAGQPFYVRDQRSASAQNCKPFVGTNISPKTMFNVYVMTAAGDPADRCRIQHSL